jgi:signal transduction histidine kinase
MVRRVQQLHEDFGINVTVRDREGRVLAMAGGELPPLTAREVAELSSDGVVVRPRPTWLAAASIRDPATTAVLGTVEISARRRFGPPGLLGPVVTAALVLAIVAVAAAPLARRISRPVERLTDAARRLGGGDLGARVPLAGPARARHRWRIRRRHREDELQELTRAFNEMAERVERLVRGQTELLANVSHELRSPLARIRVALELLPRSGDAGPRLADVESDLAELDRLIEDVLTATRLEVTGLPAHLAKVDVMAMLAQLAARAEHDPLVAGKLAPVAGGPPLPIVADGALLRRALWNLVENAAKYGAPPITLAAARDGEGIALSVTDTGPGIPAGDRERVLAPFGRLDPARTPRDAGEPPRGHGLGLTLARRIAEVHGGTLTIGPAAVSGDRELGCRVVLRIPGGGG